MTAAVGLFFGSDEGNTESISYRIQQRLGKENCKIHDVSSATQMEFANYNKIILGIPTWDFGQIQSDWEEFWNEITEIDFSGKVVALFGLGDQFGYADFFLDAMGMLHDLICENGATIIGHWSTHGYEFDASKAKIENQDMFVGLGIDEDQQSEHTAARLNTWCTQIHKQFGLETPICELND